METIRILYIAEIVGSSGVFTVKTVLPVLKEELRPHLVVANVDGTTGGFGIGKNHSIYLHKLGIDVMTSGECVFYKKDMVGHIADAPYILRPGNYPNGAPGRGWCVVKANGREVGIISMLGISGYAKTHLDNPFNRIQGVVDEITRRTPIILMDFHAPTTAEKMSMFYHVDGSISAFVGSHAKVQTADERISDGGTAAITDAGRTGSSGGVGGLDTEIELRKFLTQIHERSKAGWDALELQGVVVDIAAGGKAESIARVKRTCPQPEREKSHDGNGKSNADR